MDDQTAEALGDIARENTEASRPELKDDEDHETDVDLQTDNPGVRLGLYYALQETRGEPGLSIKSVASVVMTALDRAEASALVNELNRNLNA